MPPSTYEFERLPSPPRGAIKNAFLNAIQIGMANRARAAYTRGVEEAAGAVRALRDLNHAIADRKKRQGNHKTLKVGQTGRLRFN